MLLVEALDRVADRVTIMRDGGYVWTKDFGDVTVDDIVPLLPGDGRGMDLAANPQAQAWVRRLAAEGHEIGSHGGWIHNWFAANLDTMEREAAEAMIDRNSLLLTQFSGRPVREYSAPVGHHPAWVTGWLRQREVRAFYFTGDTGMAPTRSFQDGRRPRPDIWSFPVLGFGRHASFEEARAAGTPEQVIADWLDTRLPELFEDALSLFIDNRIFKQRNVDIAIVSQQECQELGFSGVMVRGSGAVNSAITGTPRRPIRNVTATRNRSASSSASSAGALSTSSWVNEYGWNHAPCHGSRRLAMTSPGSQVPSSRATAASAAPAGRTGMTGASSDCSRPPPSPTSSPTASSRTHTSTPSSYARNGFQPNSRPPSRRSPCQGQINPPQSTLPVARSAPRCGQAAGPTCRVRCWSRQATSSTPSTRVPNGRSVRTSVLAAKAYQFPLGLRRARCRAASMICGWAS